MSDAPLLIRQISLADIEDFRRIRLESLQREPDAFASTFEEWSAFADVDWRQRMDRPMFVAFDTNEPVGLMSLKRFEQPKMRHRAVLGMVYVRKSFRGSGVSTSLLDAAFKYAGAEQISQIELAVREDNRSALNFYRNQGFQEVGSIPNGFVDGDEGFHEVLMVRLLPAR
ncbi:GNAT family N-acetyltransferase (plasmid) [Agrobacterium tumefaciens]|nr:GNAT family N-acetyltransferase [Agrobacterium tumefaciens]